MALRCFLNFFCFVAVQSVVYKLKGEQVQWVPDITQQPNHIVWSHNGKTMVEYNHNVGQLDSPNDGRITLDKQTAQLQISDLRLEDSGKYECEIFMEEKGLPSSFDLVVMEKAPKPTISCQMSTNSSSKMSAELLCTYDRSQTRSSFQLEWISEGKVQRGPWLRISLGGELDEQQYTCRVSNLLSQENATFTAKDCSPDAGLSAGAIVGIVVVCILVAIGGFICFIKCNAIRSWISRNNGAEPDVESNSMRSKQESSGDPRHSEVNGINKAEPAGVSNGGMLALPSNQKSSGDPQHSEVKDGHTPAVSAATAHEDVETQQGPTQTEVVLDEEKVPLLEGQPAPLPPQPQNQLDTEEEWNK